MLTREDILQVLASKKLAFEQEFQVTKLGLFGSFAKNEQVVDSDIDVLIEFEPRTDHLFEKKSRIKQILAEHFNRRVDLCREKFIKPYFKQQILNNAIYV